jgi:DNA-binding NtrC family response regulator
VKNCRNTVGKRPLWRSPWRPSTDFEWFRHRAGFGLFLRGTVLVNLAASKACLDLLSDMQQLWPDARIVLVSAFDDIHLYAETIQLGAYDFLPRPLETDELGIILQRTVQPAQTKLKS